jgi:hypothetical protein
MVFYEIYVEQFEEKFEAISLIIRMILKPIEVSHVDTTTWQSSSRY